VQCGAPEVKAGDEVAAVGFPELGFFSTQLSDAECRVVSSGSAPAAREAGVKELADGCDADLITAEARVLQRLDRDGRTELAAQVGGVNLTIMLPEPAPYALQQDALVRVTGVCRVSATRSGGYRARPTAYELWPRGPEDLVVMRGAPWWTSRRLALGLSGAAFLALVALTWVALLRRQVARQLTVIESKAQREAVIEERQRIAREFHDTLEQELAGLSLRLDAATPRVEDEKARALLEQQRKLLQRLQTETRDFVWDLRDAARQDASLDVALNSLLSHLQVNTAVPIQFQANGSLPPLPALVQHHLLRITREAVNNAVKYAGATRIEVSLANEPDKPLLSIVDDGRGFDVAAVSALEGHFGIRGMQERARKINAQLQIHSKSGEGTRVELTLQLPMTKT
jgi:signal transduction histidine kinase